MHSRIPPCCIDFFVNFWVKLWCEDYQSWHLKTYDHDTGYVRCAACILAERQAKVHMCSESCRELMEVS